MAKSAPSANRIYKRQPTGQRQSIPFIPDGSPNVVSQRRRFSYTMCAVLVSLCLVLGIATIVFMPLLTGGAGQNSFSPLGRGAASTGPQETVVAYETKQEAEAALGYTVVLPTLFFPEGTQLAALNVVNGRIFEAIYTLASDTFVFRMAHGNEDPSNDNTNYAFTGTVTLEGIVCRVEGDSEENLRLAVWIDGNNIFSLSSSPGAMPPAVVGSVVDGVSNML